MEEVRQLVQEEGREARNLVAFHVAVDTPARVSRKPPRSVAPPARRAPPLRAARLRSASAGRDKRSELRARYWALLFGDLQRAIGEIYNTVEAHENLNECQEVILVLENYTRDFKALGEWFRLKWEYDNTPPPQRPQSLAWEIRKTDFVRPESRRTYSVRSSPSVSGKNSPCLSGHNTPSGKNSPVAGKVSPGSGKISPRVTGHASTSPKGNVEFFSNKIASKIATKPEAKSAKETRLSDIKEKDIKNNMEEADVTKDVTKVDVKDEKTEIKPIVEIGKAKECPTVGPKQVVIKSLKHVKVSESNIKPDELSSQAKATTAMLDAMENDFLAKNLTENNAKNENLINQDKEVEKVTESKSMKISLETTEGNTSERKNSNSTDSPEKSEDNFGDVSNESSPVNSCDDKPPDAENINGNTETVEEKTEVKPNGTEESTDVSKESNATNISNLPKEISKSTEAIAKKIEVVKDIKDSTEKDDTKKEEPKKTDSKINTDLKATSRPAYSQAAAKPKPVTSKPEVKTPVRSISSVARNKNVVEIASTVPKTRQFPKRNQTSKCSYPFNLTTGRTSLFDATPSITKVVAKKAINRSVQIGSGDAKLIQAKIDTKKRPPRPTSLKINEKSDKKEKANATLEKIKDCEEYSSSDTIITQIDMSRIESSESLKTLVPEELEMIEDVTNSIEVLNVDGNKNDNEGWLTVKSRRLSRESKKQSKSHWANRFNQPSATTSLPTLNMISPKQETNHLVNKTTKLDRAQSEQPEKLRKPEKVKVTVKPKAVTKVKDPAMIRQKSDVTGLKTHSARNKATKRAEKLKDMAKNDGELTKNRLHSSLESLTTGLARSQESTEEAFDFDKWKAEFKSTFKYLDDDDQIPNHNEILKTADPSEMSEIAEMTSQIEENEKKLSWALDFQSDVDQRKLCEEEDLLNRQIMELQQVSDIDVDTETDDTETDAEILCEDNASVPSCTSPETLGALAASLEDQYETALAGMSWAERVDTLVVLEALVARDPGRAQQLHAKLSQGIKRRGSFQDALRRLQAKQARAERQRLEYQTERARKIHQLLARVEEVKVAKNQLIEEKRMRMERRLQKAAENRDQHLKDIVRKAHDEEEKLREIAFIKQLEAENRRHEFLDQCRSHTTRLRLMRRDRLDKLEQKAAREAAVGARRQALEAARKLHVETLLEKRKERDARVEELKELKKQERDDAAREKAEGVKSRLSALAAAAELEADALRSRIRDKQDASQQRLESHLQAIREKATGPRQATTSESQDPSSKEEKELQEEAERLEQERKDREKQKAIKKRARKVKQKLLATCNETPVLNDNTIQEPNPASNKLHKVVHQLSNILTPLLDSENIDNGKKNENNDNGKKNENNDGQKGSESNDKRKNSVDDEIDKNNKKNKKLNNKIVNGNTDDTESSQKKSKKKKSTEETIETKQNTDNNAAEINKTVNQEPEIVPQSQEIADSVKENKKKRKNKKNQENRSNNDRPKLSKTSSVCSSLSDASKASYKSDRKSKVVIDITFLERHLNELHRMMEKFDKNSKDKSIPQKVHGLKILGQLLAVAAEREDLAPQFSAKSLTTAVTIISRVISACRVSAAYFITTNICVHMVKLLSNQLEKDLQSDQRETELAKQLSDCLYTALGSVHCSTQYYEERREKVDDVELLTMLRGRAHTLISYICLCGCISRAENAGEVRDSIQNLLTVCVDLCQPCDADVGSERTSATQSLRCALGTSVCGARAEFCMLFAQDADTEQCGGFSRAANTARLLRAVAELDHHIVQEAFGEGGWPLEFRAAVARLLSKHAPNDKEAPRNNQRVNNQRRDQNLSETMVLDLIVLVGFVVVNNPQLQETICDGWSVIKTLCTLPANWLVSKAHSHALLPTLLALAERPSAAAAIATELSVEMLEEYIETPEAQNVKLVQVIKQGRAKKNTAKK